MINLIFNTAIYSMLFLTLFVIGELLYHKLKIKGEWTRKIVHVFGGLISLTFPLYLQNHWQVLFLTFSFVGILSISLLLNILPSINNVKRTTHGSIIFPLIIYLCYICYQSTGELFYFYIPIVILAFGDPAANVIGKKFPFIPYKILGYTKTISGSIAFLITAFVTSFSILHYAGEWAKDINILVALSVSIITMFVESLSHKGYDNLTVPITAIVVIAIFNNYIFV